MKEAEKGKILGESYFIGRIPAHTENAISISI